MTIRRVCHVGALVLFFVLPRSAFAQGCYESSIVDPSPFMGNDGEILKLADGSRWKVKFEFEYLYEYYPSVVICPGSGRLTVAGKTLNVELVGTSPNRARQAQGTTKQSQTLPTPDVIESRIVNEFNGFDHGNIYRLANGQIWEQVEYWIWVWVWVGPQVIIWSDGGVFKMKVENIEHAIGVRRIR